MYIICDINTVIAATNKINLTALYSVQMIKNNFGLAWIFEMQYFCVTNSQFKFLSNLILKYNTSHTGIWV